MNRDKGKRDSLSIADFKKVLELLEIKLRSDEIGTIIKKFDVNNEQRIYYKLFIKYMKKTTIGKLFCIYPLS